jgi:hypothetical protein
MLESFLQLTTFKRQRRSARRSHRFRAAGFGPVERQRYVLHDTCLDAQFIYVLAKQKPDFLVDIHLLGPTLRFDEAQAVRCAIENDFPGSILLDDSVSLISFYWHALEHRSAGDVVRRLQSRLLSFRWVEGFKLCQGGIEIANLQAIDAIHSSSERLVADDHRERFEV